MGDDRSDTVSRRELMKGAGTVAATSVLAGSVGRSSDAESAGFDLDELLYPLHFLQRVDWRNLAMLPNGLEHLEGASSVDWEYNEDHFWQKMGTFVEGVMSGKGMNEFQKYSAPEGYVSSPEDGIGMAVTDRGRVSSLFFPHTGYTTHIPYFTHDDGLLTGAKPMEGSFAGIDRGEGPEWLWEPSFDDGREIWYREGTGMLDISYGDGDVEIEETSYALWEDERIVREYTIRNTSEESFDGDFLYYTRANVNDNQQDFIVWESNENVLSTGEELVWEDEEGPYQLRIGADREPDGTDISVPIEVLVQKLLDGELPSEGVRELAGTVEEKAFMEEAQVVLDTDVMEGTYLGGTMRFDLDLEPGEEETVSVYLAGGENPGSPGLERTVETREADIEQRWHDWTEDIDTSGMREDERAMYRRAVATLGAMHDPETGAMPAAPNIQPMYYPSWIRDAAIVSVAMARAGKEDIATSFLGEFCPEVQEKDGSFRQCYDSSGDQAGIIEIENDQQPIFAWAVKEVYDETGDRGFLEETWPAVRDALEYTMDSVVDNGLLAATPDYAEMPTDVRQSLFTNAFAYRGLLDGAEMAEEIGYDGSRYRKAAEEIGEATYREFFGERDEMATQYGFFGGSDDLTSIDSMAVWPTGWAEDYGVDEELEDRFVEKIEEEDREELWTPGNLTMAAMLYRRGREDSAESLVDRIADERTAAGDIVETSREEGDYFASPLGWAQASYLLAMDEKYGRSDA